MLHALLQGSNLFVAKSLPHLSGSRGATSLFGYTSMIGLYGLNTRTIYPELVLNFGSTLYKRVAPLEQNAFIIDRV